MGRIGARLWIELPAWTPKPAARRLESMAAGAVSGAGTAALTDEATTGQIKGPDVILGTFAGASGGWIGSRPVHRRWTWTEQSGMLAAASKTKGSFGVGSATAADADILGHAWVGDGYAVASDGKTILSADGLRQYRLPAYKRQLGWFQANLEWRPDSVKEWQSNGHIWIIDLP